MNRSIERTIVGRWLREQWAIGETPVTLAASVGCPVTIMRRMLVWAGCHDDEIRAHAAEGLSRYAISRLLHVRQEAVTERWADLGLPVVAAPTRVTPEMGRPITRQQRRQIWEMRANGSSCPEIAEATGVTPHTVTRWIRRAMCRAVQCQRIGPGAGRMDSATRTYCPVCRRSYHTQCYVAHGLTGHCERCELEARHA